MALTTKQAPWALTQGALSHLPMKKPHIALFFLMLFLLTTFTASSILQPSTNQPQSKTSLTPKSLTPKFNYPFGRKSNNQFTEALISKIIALKKNGYPFWAVPWSITNEIEEHLLSLKKSGINYMDIPSSVFDQFDFLPLGRRSQLSATSRKLCSELSKIDYDQLGSSWDSKTVAYHNKVRGALVARLKLELTSSEFQEWVGRTHGPTLGMPLCFTKSEFIAVSNADFDFASSAADNEWDELTRANQSKQAALETVFGSAGVPAVEAATKPGFAAQMDFASGQGWSLREAHYLYELSTWLQRVDAMGASVDDQLSARKAAKDALELFMGQALFSQYIKSPAGMHLIDPPSQQVPSIRIPNRR